jgi:crotonobetaine/carnitine-CoA ligase
MSDPAGDLGLRSPMDPFDGVHDLGSLTKRAAQLWPERVAMLIDQTGEEVTFRAFDERSDAIAAALRQLGVDTGDRVAVMLRNVTEFPLAWIGIAKAGATMVPVNVNYRTEDARYVLQHSGSRTVLTAEEFLPLLASLRDLGLSLTNLISVDSGGGSILLRSLIDHASMSPLPTVVPEQTANIQYTSGTTGQPKGCVLSHFYWCRLARVVVAGPPRLGPDDVLLTAQPFYYMDPQWNVATCLLAGSRLIVLDRFHPSTFWDRVRQYGVTFFYCLGMMPNAMLLNPPSESDRDHRVRAIHCSAIPTKRHAELEQRWGVPWYEVFGMTETGGDIRMFERDHDSTLGTGCIGRPHADREVRIVDENDRPAPRGVAGQMVIRGPGMMDMYFADLAATQAAFRSGWFHTGDLVRQDVDGLIYYLGRTKDMIRRSGENIAAAEVEIVLMQYPKVRLAACVPVPDELRGEEVKAYLVLRAGETRETAPPSELHDWCLERLAYFKVPRYWEYRDDLPLTPSERVAKAVLTAEREDLRRGAWDSADQAWH